MTAPFYDRDGITIYCGDCRNLVAELAAHEIAGIVTDPPYGETSLAWDARAGGWQSALAELVPSGSLWCFGSMRYFLETFADFKPWAFAQDVVWEKHNGSSLHADRFRRVHEHALHFYQGRWDELYKDPQLEWQSRSRVVRKQSRPAQWSGATGETTFVQAAGLTKLMRSVIYSRSMHRRAEHPTQKPEGLVEVLVRYSIPPGAVVLDPFCGSGTTLAAAKRAGRRAVGVELDPAYCEIAARRLDQGVLEL